MALVLLSTNFASAQGSSAIPSDRPSLSYRAPADCPNQASFEVQSSESLARLGAGGRLDITLTPNDGGFHGELQLVGADSTRWARALGARDCDHLVSALALSLAIHADRPSDGPRPRAPADDSRRSASPDSSQPPVSPTPQTSSIVDDVAPSGAMPSKRSGWRFALTAGGSVRSGLGERLDPSARGGLDASSSGGTLQSYRLGFELGVGVARRLPPEFGERRWDHGWWTANAQGCPWGYALTVALHVQPCLSFHVGRYSAELEGGIQRSSWFGFAELAGHWRVVLGRWSGSVELGGFIPVAPLGVEREGRVFFRQELGLVAAISMTYAPLELDIE